ncbi:hypothetical protein BSKO_11306 [Bryopsis sp. KO-2023]|nr:hypothetical protein BSKO_11306 [Bryopsis sp. KO-2023]
MTIRSAVILFVGVVLLPATFALLTSQPGVPIPTKVDLTGPFLCGAKPLFGKKTQFAEVKCDSNSDCFKCGGGLFKCESCPTCCGGEKRCVSKTFKVVCPPPPPCAPPQPGFDPCGGPPSPPTPCTKDSQCKGNTTCKGCPPCNGEPFRGTCLGPFILFGCAACEEKKCTSDDQCPGTDKCLGCVCDGPFVGTCKPKDIFLACDCPQVLPPLKP